MWPILRTALEPKEEVKSELLCCRACLGAGRLYNIHRHGLVEAYRQLTGVEVEETSPLPVHLCSWCYRLLLKCKAFRERCRKAELLLQNLAVLNTTITPEEISNVDRHTHKLIPTYTQTTINITDSTQDDNKLSVPDDTNPIILNDALDYDDYKNDDTFTHADDDDVKDVDIIKTVNLDNDDSLIIENVSVKKTFKRTRKNVSKKDTEISPISSTRSRKKVKIENDDAGDNGDKPLIDIKNTLANVKEHKKNDETNDAADGIDEKPLIDPKNTSVNVKEHKEKTETKSKRVRKKKPRVNNLYTDPEDRERFAQKYNVEIIVMTKDDELNDMVERKNSSKYLRAHNKCEECYKGFIHEDTLKRHMKDKHDPSLEYVCEFCRFRFGKRAKLTGHYRLHHKYKYICRVCNVVTRMRQHAVDHSKMHTEKFICKYCGKVFNTKSTTYHTHVRSKHAAELPWCRLCGDAFVCTKTHMKRLHKEALNPDPALTCSTCNTQFLNTQALYTHTKTKTRCSEVKSCVHCGDTFEVEEMLREHVLSVHKIQFSCDKCNKIFSHESRLNNHILEKHSEVLDAGSKSHKGVKKQQVKKAPAMCDICGKIIPYEHHMVQHQRMHTGEKPYSCAHCPKRFRLLSLLQNHIRTHTGERPYKCKYCPNTFKTMPGLSRHHLVHTGVRRYPCSICEKRFATKTDMKVHVKTVHMNMSVRNRKRNKNVPS